MHLSPRELDKLMLHNAGFLAQKRYARGLQLNYVETVALISSQMLEFIRDGNSVAELMEKGKGILGLSDVLPGVAEMIPEIQVEGTFPNGTKLVTVHHPVCREKGDAALALYGSGLNRNPQDYGIYKGFDGQPGEVLTEGPDLQMNAGREAVSLKVLNRGDRPVQIGSHYPFFEANPALEFDRSLSYGKRLDIPAGTAVRFEPGEHKTVTLVEIAGNRKVLGGNSLIDGALSTEGKEKAMGRVQAASFNHKEQ